MRDRRSSGFTLVEVMIVVAIIGIIAAVAIPAFTRYVRKSHTAEAVMIVDKLWAGSVAYYMADWGDGEGGTYDKQFPGPAAQYETQGWEEPDCGCQSSQRCPGGSPVYTNDDVWKALKFAMPDAHSYLPGYTSANVGLAAQFTALARGDLNCNHTVALFERVGKVAANGDVEGARQPAITNELE